MAPSPPQEQAPATAAGQASIPSTLITRVPRLRLVQPWSSAGMHGCKLRSRGTRRFNFDGILASGAATAAQRQRGREARHQDGQEPTEPSRHGVLPAPLVPFILRARRAGGVTQNPPPVPGLWAGTDGQGVYTWPSCGLRAGYFRLRRRKSAIKPPTASSASVAGSGTP